eukprot:IDg5677t1
MEEWTQPLHAAARQLHELLLDVDTASQPPWQGVASQLAVQRYENIFLPMLAAHLAERGTVTLSPEARKRSDSLVHEARKRLYKLYYRAQADPVYQCR